MPEPEPNQEDTGPAGAALDRVTAFETILLVGGLVLFLVLIYEMHAYPLAGQFVNPPLIAAAAVILLWPVRKHRPARAILAAGGFLLAVWFIDKLSGVLVPFFIVYILALLFDPLVTQLRERRGVPRGISAAVVTVLLVGAMGLVLFLLVPSLIQQLQILAARVIGLISGVQNWILTTPALDRLERDFGVDKQQIVIQVSQAMEAQARRLAESIPAAAQRVLSYVGTLLGLITSVAIIPILLYYTLKDYPFIKRRLIELFPTFGGERHYLERAGDIVGSYLRGQLIISAITAFNVSVALMLFRVPFALLIGLVAGVTNMIPSLGPIITNVFAILLTVMFAEPWFGKSVIVFLVLMGQSILEQSVLTPKILSSQVGLHPVLILLSLFVFGYFMGIFGFLIAVPATALIMATYKSYRHELHFELAASRVRMPSFGRRIFRRRSGAAIYPPTEEPAEGDGAETPGAS